MNTLIARTLTTLALIISMSTASAVPVFSDNFDSSNGGVVTLNWGGDADWTVCCGTVDLIGAGLFDLLPGNGLYIDLDGSTGDTGVFSHWEMPLAAGDYNLMYDLAGSQRGIDTTAIVWITAPVFGGGFANLGSAAYALAANAGFTTFTQTFTMPATANVQFAFFEFPINSADNIGPLLDNVSVSAVPEPGTLALLGFGLAGMGLTRRRKKV